MLRSTFASLAFVLLATGGAVSAPTAADILAAKKQGNYALALRLARPLAEAGNAEAQAMVGNLYELGLGVAQDHSKALGWFTRAADQGNVTAETALGRMYRKGAGVQMDSVKAYRWFALAAKQGDIDAHGDLCSEGNGVPQDYGEAAKWYRIAAEMNNDAAQAQADVRNRQRCSAGLRSGAYVVQPSSQPKFFRCGTVSCCHEWH
jgi:uncharacterized protein